MTGGIVEATLVFESDGSRKGDIEAIVLSVSKDQWRKVAMIVASAKDECDARQIETTYEEIASLIGGLRQAGMLETQGDISNWRHSEARLRR